MLRVVLVLVIIIVICGQPSDQGTLGVILLLVCCWAGGTFGFPSAVF